MYQMEEQDKTPDKQLNEVEIGKLPEKRIQNIDSEDDPGPQKKNGGKDQEDARNMELLEDKRSREEERKERAKRRGETTERGGGERE